MRNLQQLMDGGVEHYQFEKRYRRKDGQVIWVKVIALAIRNEHGQIQRLLGVVEDITQRRQAEETTARLVGLMESADDAIIGKSLDGTITSWNRGAERLYGYSAEEAVGQPITLIIPEDRRNELDDIMRRLRQGERIERLETIRQRKDGTRVQIALTVSPVVDRQGRLIGASAIGRDITERRRLRAGWQAALRGKRLARSNSRRC